ncbi:MAG: TGS domain-containing protein, partial [Bacteroidota bacterium]
MPEQIQISLPDGSVRSYDKGVTGMEVARDISEGLARNALSIKFNGEVIDLSRPLHTDGTAAILTWRDNEGKATLWHSSAHILAEAVEALYPGVKLGIGPAIESGFYYDIDFGDYEFGAHDFEKIEKKFLELARTGETFERREISKAEAAKHYADKGNEYKQELIG